MADKVPLGMEFMNWQNLPSLTQTLAGGGSPLLKIAGLLLSGGEKSDEGSIPSAPAIGTGVMPPQIPGGIGMVPNAGGLGVKPPAQFGALPSLPTMQTQPTSQVPAGQDLDGDGIVDSFWGVKK